MLLTACLEPYVPEVIQAPHAYLVVEGSINSRGSSTIRLSRAISLSTVTSPPAETKATVFIEEEGGMRYPLTEKKAGTYTSAVLSLNAGRRVRLRVATAAQQEYVSDFTQVIVTPVIDSITWKPTGHGLQIAANAHDDTDQLKYFRWEYEETWEFATPFYSTVRYDSIKHRVVDRTKSINKCWQTKVSTNILLATTAKLGRSQISEAPILLLPRTSDKLYKRYSILVKQYAMTKEEYNYWVGLQKNTQNIGTLFDPLPSQIAGNMHSVHNPEEVVLGFISCQSVTEKRIFADRAKLPYDWPYVSGYELCMADTLPKKNDYRMTSNRELFQLFENVNYIIPIERLKVAKINGRDTIYYYSFSTADCVDCRTRGVLKKPIFW
nr:DUF4249 domain-containing protein [Hymenobacter pini]